MKTGNESDPFAPETLKAGQVFLEEALKSKTGNRRVWCPVQKKMVKPEDRCVGSGKLLYATFLAEDLANLAVLTQSAPLALLLWLLARWFSGSRRNPFPLTKGEIKGLRLSRHRKVRALKILVKAGLISVQPRPGKSHLVTLLWKPPKPGPCAPSAQVLA
jgi:hypothetical protein